MKRFYSTIKHSLMSWATSIQICTFILQTIQISSNELLTILQIRRCLALTNTPFGHYRSSTINDIFIIHQQLISKQDVFACLISNFPHKVIAKSRWLSLRYVHFIVPLSKKDKNVRLWFIDFNLSRTIEQLLPNENDQYWKSSCSARGYISMIKFNV